MGAGFSRPWAGVIFGLVPALQSSRADLNASLKASTGRSGAVLRHNKARPLLVVIEVALALVALVAVWLPARRASGVTPLAALRYE